VIAAVVWLIRRIAGVKSKNNYLGYAFGSFMDDRLDLYDCIRKYGYRQFKRTGNVREDITIVQPSKEKMVINVNREAPGRYYGSIGSMITTTTNFLPCRPMKTACC
jgi:hypothetical protein